MWTMLVIKLVGAILLILASTLLVDWVFSGSKWAHKYFSRAPEIWRPMEAGDAKKTERRVVQMSLLMSFIFSLTSLLFYFVMRPGLIFTVPLVRAFATATFLWLLIPLPQLITQHLFIKYHPGTTAQQLAGWYVKLFAASLILSFLF